MKATVLAGLLLAVFLAACGGGGGNNVQVQKASSPEQLGALIGQTYVDMLNKATPLVQPLPPAEELKPKLEALKERYAKALVEYGRQREAMSQEDKDKVVVSARGYVQTHPTAIATWWVPALNNYRPTDESLSQTVFSLRDLTQYAFWELLKKQEPEEAKRLGVK